jgi:small membrane protein
MIAQLILSAFLLNIFPPGDTEYGRSPAVGLVTVSLHLADVYFVWVPSHATDLADFVGVGAVSSRPRFQDRQLA